MDTSPLFLDYVNNGNDKDRVENEWMVFSVTKMKYDQLRYLDSDGNERKYLGRADGSSNVGDVMHRVSNMIIELGDRAKSMIDHNRQQVEVAVATASAKEYVSVRAQRAPRVRRIPSWATTPEVEDNSSANAGANANPAQKTLTPADITGATANATANAGAGAENEE